MEEEQVKAEAEEQAKTEEAKKVIEPVEPEFYGRPAFEKRAAPNAARQNYTSYTGAQGFINRDEGNAYSLKNGWVQNILSGEGFVKEDAVLTNRRIYYSAKQGILMIKKREEIVDLKDITGTKIFNYKPYGLLLSGGIFLLLGLILLGSSKDLALFMVLMGVAEFIVFAIRMKSVLTIEYAGGKIELSLKKYGLKNIRDFQRQIYEGKARQREYVKSRIGGIL